MSVLLFIMLVACTNIIETVADDKPWNTCCGECYSVCTPPIGDLNLICIKNCFKDCATRGFNCGAPPVTHVPEH